MDKLLLIDGSNLLFQIFYGMSPKRVKGRDGKTVHGTLGFIGAVLKLLRLTNATHTAVVFANENAAPKAEWAQDNCLGSVPNLLPDESPNSQLPDILRTLKKLNICTICLDVADASNSIASYAKGYQELAEVIIASFDSRFFQLIDSNIGVLRYRGEHTFIATPKAFFEKYGIRPEQYPDFKALVGDRAYGFIGAESVKEKTAVLLLNRLSSLDAICSIAPKITKIGLRESLTSNAERLLENRNALLLTPYATTPYSLVELSYTPPKNTTQEILKSLEIM